MPRRRRPTTVATSREGQKVPEKRVRTFCRESSNLEGRTVLCRDIWKWKIWDFLSFLIYKCFPHKKIGVRLHLAIYNVLLKENHTKEKAMNWNFKPALFVEQIKQFFLGKFKKVFIKILHERVFSFAFLQGPFDNRSQFPEERMHFRFGLSPRRSLHFSVLLRRIQCCLVTWIWDFVKNSS